MLKTMIDPATPASVRVRAAEAIFNHAAKAIEIEDIEARVAALEAAVMLQRERPMRLSLLRGIRELEELKKPVEERQNYYPLRAPAPAPSHVHRREAPHSRDGIPLRKPGYRVCDPGIPGPGPELNFGFERRTMVIEYIESDGNG